jgi:beta-hydroxylase
MQLDFGSLVSPPFVAAYLYLACVCYVHFRGNVRLRFGRQLTEHSGIFSPFNVLMYAFSAAPRTPILNVKDFPELAPLRENWKTIRDEALALQGAGEIDYAEKHNDLAFVAFKKRGWKRFYLKWYHDFLPSAQELCPRTVALVRSIPSINAAAFTMLPPGKKLGKHRDPFASSLRYHLGLSTPNSDKCLIWIDGQPYSWRDGEDIVFDETFVHWAENETDQTRIIFFADFTRPLHTPVLRGLVRFLNRYGFRITRSHNRVDEARGSLNHLTPIIFAIKYFFLDLKSRRRRLYYAGKYALGALLVYLLFVRPLFMA